MNQRFVALVFALLSAFRYAVVAATDPAVTAFVMVDESGKELHRFKRGINDDFAVRDTVYYGDIGTRKVSIKVETTGDIHYIKFYFNNKVFPSREAPFAMQGSSGGMFPSVPWLGIASKDKSIRATLFDTSNTIIGSFKLRFIMAEGGNSPVPTPIALPVATPVSVPAPAPVPVPVPVRAPVPMPVPVPAPVPMPVPAPVPVPLPVPVSSPRTKPTRLMLARAGTFSRPLQEIRDGDVIDLSDIGGSLSAYADVDQYVTRCRFFFDDKVHTENVIPFVMSGNSGDNFRETAYLGSAGGKVVRVEVTRDGFPMEELVVKFRMVDGAPVPSPVASPTGSPVKAPVIAPVPVPVVAPVRAPVVAPVPVPVVAPVPVPVMVPTPIASPVSSRNSRVTAFIMVDANGRELHRFKRGIDDDFSVRDTVRYSEIGTREVTIKVEVSNPELVTHVRFFFNRKVFPSKDAPYAMQGSENGVFATVPWLGVASVNKSIRATMYGEGNVVIGSTKLRFIMAE